MYKIKLKGNVQVSKVDQIVRGIAVDIDSGFVASGQKLPTINEFSKDNGVSRDTIEKAYKRLRKLGYIVSNPGRGYFVLNKPAGKLAVLLIFNKLSSFKKDIYYGILAGVGKKARVDLQLHHYDPNILGEIILRSKGKYDYYVVMPHFFSGVSKDEYLSVLKSIPTQSLVLLDKFIPELKDLHKAVYQDFRADVYQALYSFRVKLKKYSRVIVCLPEDIHHPKEILDGIKEFCFEQKKKFTRVDRIETRSLQKGTVYIVVEEDDLARLIKKTRNEGWKIGVDIGIISYNDTVLKEVLDITVMTTDFYQMGKLLAKLLFTKEIVQYKNRFSVLQRGSL